MEDLGPAIMLAAILAFIGFRSLLKYQSEMNQKKMLFDAQKHLLDKLGSAAEVTQFLGSPEGKEFFDRLKTPPPPPPPPGPSPAEVMFAMIWGGVGLAAVGAGFFVAATMTGRDTLMVPGAICLFAGIGVLLGLVITHKLARRWGIFKDHTTGTRNP